MELAKLLIPENTPDFADIVAKFPKRELPESAKVVRVAPSPTGSPHFGLVFAAMVDEAIAYQTKGLFFLRIEDTDKKREVDGGIGKIIEAFANFDVKYSEGPVSETEELGKYMHKGMVVVLESTTYPGTTREVLLPKLGVEHNLKVGEDWFLAFSPERVDPGREDYTTINTPKVVGGITEDCGEVASAWYGGAIKTVHRVSTAEAAEMSKLLENTFRMINIGLVNELAIMCQRLGVDVWEVIDAAASKPFGFMKFTPGPGLGGHCIPIDPLYLSWKMKSFHYNARFIELASEINTNMPRYVVARILEAMNDRSMLLKGSKVLVLGVAYKPDIDDVRESPAMDVIGLLKNKGAQVEYHDPYIPHIHHEYDGWQMDSVKDLMKSVKEADAVVIITNHKNYDYKAIIESAKFVFDSRNATGKFGKEHEKVERL